MRTQTNPFKKTNFEERELRARKKSTNKSQRNEGKKIINKMISEDQEIKEEINSQFSMSMYEDDLIIGIDWGMTDYENDLYN